MTFISVSTIKKVRKDKVSNVPAKLTIRRRGMAYITKAVMAAAGDQTIDVQLDQLAKTVRVKTGAGLPYQLSGRVGHTFYVNSTVAKIFMRHASAQDEALIMELTKGDDGWWYGSYEISSTGL